MPNPTYKTFQFDVPASLKGQLIKPPAFELDKNVASIAAVGLDANNRGSLASFGSQQVLIGGLEVFPEGYRSHLLMCGISVPPNQKLYRFGTAMPFGTGKLEISFRDTWQQPDAGQPDLWLPYTVFIILEQQLR